MPRFLKPDVHNIVNLDFVQAVRWFVRNSAYPERERNFIRFVMPNGIPDVDITYPDAKSTALALKEFEYLLVGRKEDDAA